MPRVRLAVALVVPGRAGEEVDVLRRAVGAGDAVHHVPPHVTLVPPVNVAADRVGEAEAVVRSAARGVRPFRVTLGPPTTFLPDNPVLYLAVGGAGAGDLHRLRDEVFVAPLARTLTWPFVPHVTLLDGGDPSRVEAGVVALADHVAEVTMTSVAMLREQRDEAGVRVWRPVVEAPLGGPATVARGGLALELTTGVRLDAEAAAWSAAAWDDHDRAAAGPAWRADEPVAVTARRDGAVVGTATGAVRGDEAYLARLVVDAAVRGEGVGGHLLAAYVAEAAARGCARVVLRTVEGGAAERFYRERGFTAVAALPRWRRGEDFVVLERVLG